MEIRACEFGFISARVNGTCVASQGCRPEPIGPKVTCGKLFTVGEVLLVQEAAIGKMPGRLRGQALRETEPIGAVPARYLLGNFGI
jgi:hypothetical protein